MAVLTAMVRDPLSLLAMRSPGGRGAGALLSSKPPRVPDTESETASAERVLPILRELPPGANSFGDGAALGPGGSAPTPLEAILPETDLVSAGLLGPAYEGPSIGGALSPPWGPGSFGGGGGGSGGGGGGDGDGVDRPSPPSPVPEVATWAMMILGFFVAGFSIRREAARRARLEV